MARAQARLGNEVRIYTTNQDGNGELGVSTERPVQWDGVTHSIFPDPASEILGDLVAAGTGTEGENS